MRSEPSLVRSMQLITLCIVGKAPIDHRHEQFREWRRYSNATIIVHVGGVALALVQRYNLGITPRLRCQLLNSTNIQKISKYLNARPAHVFQDLQR